MSDEGEPQLFPALTTTLASEYRFHAADRDDPAFFIDGTLRNGSLSFEIVAKKGDRHGALPGHEFFAAMLRHFGDKVEVILGTWTDTDLRENLEIFNRETKGQPESAARAAAAAFQTHTGRWARDHGFTEIRFLDARPAGLMGAYEQVLVEFVRPSATSKE